MITRPQFVEDALPNKHDSACYVDPRDGNVCSRGHRSRKDTLKYIADLEAAVDDANVVEQELVDRLAEKLDGGYNGYVNMSDGRRLWMTGRSPDDGAAESKTEDAQRPEGGETPGVDLERVPDAQRPDATEQPAKGR